MISKTEEYALRAAIQLARHHGEQPVRASALAHETGVPTNYMSKILHKLGRSGVVVSERGRGGGFRLSRAPASVTLSELLMPFAPQNGRERCLLGRDECSDADPCSAHYRWKDAKQKIADFFSQTTLADVIAERDGGNP